jgi:hypothetical protein
MKHKSTKGSIWLPMLMAIFCGLMADIASANIGVKNQSLPVKNDLLQFKAGSHVMGFKPDKAYLVNTAGFLSVEFLGAHTIIPQAVAADANRHQDNIALTPDHKDTLTNLQRVEYQGLWDGITLHYDAVQTGIAESTYFIQPGADVADIRLRYNADTELQKDGSLKIKLATRQGYITESMPVAWQIVDGRKKAVQVAYEIQDGKIGFKTGAYNKDHELIIDPTYQWHTFYGSDAEDEGNGIAVDGNGNVYVTGTSQATWGDSPIHPYTGSSDIVVLKLNSSGTLLWNTFYGSTNTDEGKSIAVDANGNVYVTGQSNTSWSDPVAPLNPHTSGFDIVVLKLDSSGAYQWHTFYGSASTDYGLGIAVDESGNSYVTGISISTWGISPLNPHAGGGNADIVVFKLDSSGNNLVWNTFYGSTSTDYGNGIALKSGYVYVTGYSNASWGSPLHAHSAGATADIMILKLDDTGALQWNTFYGSGTYDDKGYGIAVDGSGNTYVAGTSKATWGSPVNPFNGSGQGEITVLKLNTSGALQWNTFHGSLSIDNGYSIAVDGNGNVYVTGSSNATWGSPLHAYSGSTDIVALKLANSGILQGNTFYGAASVADYGYGLALDGSGNVYITGSSNATWGSSLHAHSVGLNDDIVILKISDTFKKFPWPMFLPAIIKGGVH